MIGRFLELSVHAPEVLASIEFYESLGFEQAPTGDAWPYPYAVVTDGRIGIGLHGTELPASPMLTFVLPELARRLEALEALGIDIVDRRLGGDVFNVADFLAPGGHAVRLLEARTYSPLLRPPGHVTRLGWFEEIVLPVADAAAAAGWWERLGFVPAEETEPFPRIGLTSDTVDVALAVPAVLASTALLFSDAAMPARIEALRARGFAFARRPPAGLDPAQHALLTAPEGTQFLLATTA